MKHVLVCSLLCSAQGLCALLSVGTGVGEVDSALAARPGTGVLGQTDFSGAPQAGWAGPRLLPGFQAVLSLIRCAHSAPQVMRKLHLLLSQSCQ